MKTLLLMFGLGAMLLTSCDQDITNEIYLPGAGNTSNVADSTKTGYLTINSTIAPNTAMTRAINEQWENGDAIGVFADNNDSSSWISNGKFIRKDNTSQFTSTNAYYYKDQNECNVKAYYPYNSSVTSSNPVVTFTCSEEATAEAQKNTDFMFATDKARWATPPNLVFSIKCQE